MVPVRSMTFGSGETHPALSRKREGTKRAVSAQGTPGDVRPATRAGLRRVRLWGRNRFDVEGKLDLRALALAPAKRATLPANDNAVPALGLTG